MRELTITVPGLPPEAFDPNGRGHHMARHRATVQAHNDVIAMVNVEGWQGPPMEKAEITLHWGYKIWRDRDSDNFLARSKPLIDGLTRARVIVDDSAQHVTYNLAGFYRAKQNETVITVKEQ
jgi:Holliday junction resolvase RusA-like endonuclease